MNSLLAEIQKKRKAAAEAAGGSVNKYVRRGELRASPAAGGTASEGEDRKEAKSATSTPAPASRSSSPASASSPAPSTPAPEEPKDLQITNPDAIRRLRRLGHPIRLFGESDRDRRLRLRALELLEEKGSESAGQRNDLRKALEGLEQKEEGLAARKAREREEEAGGEGKEAGGKTVDKSGRMGVDMGWIKTQPEKLFPVIYYWIKRMVREWEASMAERPEHIKQSTQGRLAAATQVQTAEYLKPLFKQLRSRALPPDVLPLLAEIVHYAQQRLYRQANDAYLRLSIGNAPWPIGVTMVGIHDRSAREKIGTNQIAHVLNDEVSRKYIQSVKRVLTFAQTKYPPDDVSQLMG